jgi:hypothetical protein
MSFGGAERIARYLNDNFAMKESKIMILNVIAYSMIISYIIVALPVLSLFLFDNPDIAKFSSEEGFVAYNSVLFGKYPFVHYFILMLLDGVILRFTLLPLSWAETLKTRKLKVDSFGILQAIR